MQQYPNIGIDIEYGTVRTEKEREREKKILQMLIYPLFASFPFRSFLVETYACGKSNLSFMATCTLNPRKD